MNIQSKVRIMRTLCCNNTRMILNTSNSHSFLFVLPINYIMMNTHYILLFLYVNYTTKPVVFTGHTV